LAVLENKPMNVSLTTEMEEWVQRKVGSGLYTSASEVVREAIRSLYEREMRQSTKLLNLREAISAGIQSAETGKMHDWSDSFHQELKVTARARRKA
jgi:antitoxin ParD1/3/4